MNEPASHLHLIVNPETGERQELDQCPGCQERDFIIAGHETTIKGWEIKYGKLRADKEVEARKHPLWPVALKGFKAWKMLGNHPRAAWGFDRFEQSRPFLQDKAYGASLEARELMMLRGIVGITYDPFTTRRKNGSVRRHDGWELLFRSRDKFEEMCNRAPKDWQERIVQATGKPLVVEVEAA